MPDPLLKMEQVQAAMAAMMDKAMQTPNEPIAMAIVDAAGNLEAYAKMDNLRIFSRRHALRKQPLVHIEHKPCVEARGKCLITRALNDLPLPPALHVGVAVKPLPLLALGPWH